MAKYTLLTLYLKKQSGDCVTLSFRQIEGIIGNTLPPSARRHPQNGLYCLQWWDNRRGASESNARLDAGFQTVMVDMEKETVKLCRIKKT